MQRVSLEAVSAASAEHDLAALRTEGIDRFCSASAWTLAAHEAFAPQREPWLFRGEHGWLLLMLARDEAGGAGVLQPLEPVWGFASPCLGEVGAPLAAEVSETLVRHEAQWSGVVLTGLAEDGPLLPRIARRLAQRYTLLRGEPTRRYRASLEGGVDGFLGRRSANLRRSLRRTEQAFAHRGMTIEDGTGSAAALYARILAVESTSWKGQAGSGLSEEPMRTFYARMVPRLHAQGGLRVLFARYEERDVGYILGGVLGDTYRGLQFSFDASLADVGVGNALQLAQVHRLCQEGLAVYDLGSDVPYKARWGEQVFDTTMLIAVH